MASMPCCRPTSALLVAVGTAVAVAAPPAWAVGDEANTDDAAGAAGRSLRGGARSAAPGAVSPPPAPPASSTAGSESGGSERPARGAVAAGNETLGAQSLRCLCLFDIDRTLTGTQGWACGGGTTVLNGIWDPAYGGGPLTLSALGSAGHGSTFCGACELGIVSAGSGGGDDMRGQLAGGFLGGRAGTAWSGPETSSPLIVGCSDGSKASCAGGILRWYAERGVHISASDVYHFDNKASSVSSFEGSGMNAHQVSCWSRSDGPHGRCGATPDEVTRRPGISYCR